MERSADCTLYLQSGDWLGPQRVWRRGSGEIKVTLYLVDAVREGQGHAGSTPATSTNLTSSSQIIPVAVVVEPLIWQPLPRCRVIAFLPTSRGHCSN